MEREKIQGVVSRRSLEDLKRMYAQTELYSGIDDYIKKNFGVKSFCAQNIVCCFRIG